jgi:acyl dehydratase
VADELPEYRIKARNTSTQSENKIHDDTVARRYGFGGGLVPGVTVYAYVTHPLVAAFGADWLDRGTASVKFVKPILEGDEVRVTGRVVSRQGGGLTLALAAATAGGGDCAVATATLPARAAAPPDAAGYAVAPLPAERPEATRACLASMTVLGTQVERYDEARAVEYLDKVSDPLLLYRGPEALVHPAFYLDQANRVLSKNVRLGPWIHTGSQIQHFAAARVGQTLSTRGRVRALSEKKGREMVELDLLLLADGSRPVAHVHHSAIYRLPPPA